MNDTMLSQANLIVDVNPYHDYATFKTNADFHEKNFVDLFGDDDDDGWKLDDDYDGDPIYKFEMNATTTLKYNTSEDLTSVVVQDPQLYFPLIDVKDKYKMQIKVIHNLSLRPIPQAKPRASPSLHANPYL